MQHGDVAFTGSVPDLYERHLGPMFFEPYARDLAERVRTAPPRNVLETAAGTGQVTRLLRDAAPDARIIATDLNPMMLALAAAALPDTHVTWETADMASLPYPDASFDLVVCQFGIMFVPDQTAAFAEARRVLTPGGRYLLNVWASLETNEIPRLVSDVVKDALGTTTFIERIPHGHGDPDAIARKLREAGFADVRVDSVKLRSRTPSAHDAAVGIVHGTPTVAEIAARIPERLAQITATAQSALEARFGDGPIDAEMHAFVFEATREQ